MWEILLLDFLAPGLMNCTANYSRKLCLAIITFSDIMPFIDIYFSRPIVSLNQECIVFLKRFEDSIVQVVYMTNKKA